MSQFNRYTVSSTFGSSSNLIRSFVSFFRNRSIVPFSNVIDCPANWCKFDLPPRIILPSTFQVTKKNQSKKKEKHRHTHCVPKIYANVVFFFSFSCVLCLGKPNNCNPRSNWYHLFLFVIIIIISLLVVQRSRFLCKFSVSLLKPEKSVPFQLAIQADLLTQFLHNNKYRASVKLLEPL